VLLRQVELVMHLKTRARVALAEDLVLGPFLGELLGEMALRQNGPGPSELPVLKAGRRRGGNLTLCLNASRRWLSCGRTSLPLLLSWEPAVGDCGVAPAWQQRCRLRLTATLVVLLPADWCNCSAVGGLVHKLKLEQRGGVPGGWILEIVARQSDLLIRAGKGAEEGNNPVLGLTTQCAL
jgi:hypothetical protein